MLELNSFELWRGPSSLTDEPVIVLATGIDLPSLNPKTGPVVQVYYLREDVPPGDALASGNTRAICGECIHAPHRDGTCYVNPAFGAQKLWRSWKAGWAPPLHRDFWPEHLGGRFVRLGAYGDPASAPGEVSLAIARTAEAHSGYTHAWRDRPDLRSICMASVSSEAERVEAERAGWRAFQVVPMNYGSLRHLEPVAEGVVVCGASAERGKRTTCQACQACGGTSSKARASVAVGSHGTRADKLVALRRIRASGPLGRFVDPSRPPAFIPTRRHPA